MSLREWFAERRMRRDALLAREKASRTRKGATIYPFQRIPRLGKAAKSKRKGRTGGHDIGGFTIKHGANASGPWTKIALIPPRP